MKNKLDWFDDDWKCDVLPTRMLYELLLSPTYRWPWKIKAICIPIEFRYDLCMTKELILRQFHDPINQMIAAIILNRVRFGNEVSIQQCVSFHFDLTSLNPSRTLFSVE